MRFGAHMSIAGGVSKAFDRAKEVGCDSLQIFLRPNLNWRLPPLDEDEVKRYLQAEKRTGIRPVVGHASYLINLAAADHVHLRKSIDALVVELERAEMLGVRSIALHPGAHMGQGEEKGVKKIALGLDKAFRRARNTRAAILLETTAGMGTVLGYRFEQLADIIHLSHFPQRLGICLDTCHIFAAGYDIRTPSAYARTMRELSRAVGIKKVRAIHVNDAKADLGARLDRHEHIGEGKIGRDGFRNLVNDPDLAHLPAILETPKTRGRDSGNKMDPVNLRRLRRLELKL